MDAHVIDNRALNIKLALPAHTSVARRQALQQRAQRGFGCIERILLCLRPRPLLLGVVVAENVDGQRDGILLQ